MEQKFSNMYSCRGEKSSLKSTPKPETDSNDGEEKLKE